LPRKLHWFEERGIFFGTIKPQQNTLIGMRYFISIFLITFCLTGHSALASEDLALAEIRMQRLMQDMRETESDGDRNLLNELLRTEIKKTLQLKGAFTYAFDSLSSYMCTMAAPDGAFRLFNWNVANNDFTHQYYCYVMHYSKRDKKYLVEELKNNTKGADDIENRILFQTHWYGALYYEIIPVKKGSKKYYTLLGWRGEDRFVTQRVLEVLYFEGRDQIKLGAPIFKKDNKMKKRVVFQYNAETRMSITYHSKQDWIVFDHLSASTGLYSGFPEMSGSDLSFDAFEWQKRYWMFIEKVDVNAPRNKNDREYEQPEGTPFGPNR